MRFRLLVLSLLVFACVPALALAMSPMHPELGAKLLGKNEVPKGSPTAHGVVNLALNASKGTICWTFTGITGITPVVSHIHRAPVGKAGPVVVPLGAAYKPKGCATAPKTPMPPALVTAATTSRQWLKAKIGYSMPNRSQSGVRMPHYRHLHLRRVGVTTLARLDLRF